MFLARAGGLSRPLAVFLQTDFLLPTGRQTAFGEKKHKKFAR